MSDIDEPEKVKRRGLVDNIRSRRNEEDLMAVLSIPQGRRFYWRLIHECGVYSNLFTGNNTTFFNLGMREIGVMLTAKLAKHPEIYIQAMKEYNEEEAKNS